MREKIRVLSQDFGLEQLEGPKVGRMSLKP